MLGTRSIWAVLEGTVLQAQRLSYVGTKCPGSLLFWTHLIAGKVCFMFAVNFSLVLFFFSFLLAILCWRFSDGNICTSRKIEYTLGITNKPIMWCKSEMLSYLVHLSSDKCGNLCKRSMWIQSRYWKPDLKHMLRSALSFNAARCISNSLFCSWFHRLDLIFY